MGKGTKQLFYGVFIFSALGVASCQWRPKAGPSWQMNKELYRKAEVSQTELKISIWDQKAWLLNEEGKVLLKTDVSTGVPGKETPTGRHFVLEKIKDKRSNRYGKYVDEQTGAVIVDKSWLHEGKLPKGSIYLGTKMPYWMRLTWHGVGVHVGRFPKRTRCSFGCIRVFHKAQPWIYQKMSVGSAVTVYSDSLIEKMSPNEDFGW